MWSIEGRERCFCHSKEGEWGWGGVPMSHVDYKKR